MAKLKILFTQHRGDQGALKDLQGNTITKAGWYDFTRLDSENNEWQDGGRYIYGDYYAQVVDDNGNVIRSTLARTH